MAVRRLRSSFLLEQAKKSFNKKHVTEQDVQRFRRLVDALEDKVKTDRGMKRDTREMFKEDVKTARQIFAIAEKARLEKIRQLMEEKYGSQF